MNISEQELRTLRLTILQLLAGIVILETDVHLIKILLDEGKYSELDKAFRTLSTDADKFSSNAKEVVGGMK